MKKIFFALFSVFLLMAPAAESFSQTSSDNPPNVFATEDFPQWAKDLRRWDIVTFGSFPFTMFTVIFITDMIRWNDANGMNFSEESRRYAPWPLKSAGAVEMTKEEYERTIFYAATLSATVALIDLAIVWIKRSKQRKLAESRPAGSFIIEKRPYLEEEAPAADEEE